MAHRVQVNKDEVVLPDGREYDSGAVVTLTDREFSQIRSALFSGGSPVLTDLGEVAGTSGDLSGLGDVVISSPQVGDLMKWDGSHWVNAQPAADIDVGGGGGGGLTESRGVFNINQIVGPITTAGMYLHFFDGGNAGGTTTPSPAHVNEADDTQIVIDASGLYIVSFRVTFERKNIDATAAGRTELQISENAGEGWWWAAGQTLFVPWSTGLSEVGAYSSLTLTSPPFHLNAADFFTGVAIASTEAVAASGGGAHRLVEGVITLAKIGA